MGFQGLHIVGAPRFPCPQSLGRQLDKEFLYEILRLFIEAIGEGIIQRFNLLPCEVFGQTVECESTSNRLVYDTPKGPQIGADRSLSTVNTKIYQIQVRMDDYLRLVSLFSRSSGATY